MPFVKDKNQQALKGRRHSNTIVKHIVHHIQRRIYLERLDILLGMSFFDDEPFDSLYN